MNMKPIFEAVIRGGNYKLSDIQEKIQKSYVRSELTEEAREDLLNQAAAGINIAGEKPDDDARFESLLRYIEALQDRVKTLEDAVFKPEESEDPDNPDNPETPAVVYEQWEPWDGISSKYQYGAIVEHNGKLWQSEHNGQNVWEPGAPGTERLWVLYKPTADEPEMEVPTMEVSATEVPEEPEAE